MTQTAGARRHAPDEAPEWVVQIISGSLQFSEACLRVYAHPGLLGVAQALNGTDFTPFNEVVSIKQPGLGGVHNPISLYDDAYIAERSRVIGWAIDARAERFGNETPFVYAPNVGREHEFVWDDAAREAIKDYNLKDLGI